MEAKIPWAAVAAVAGTVISGVIQSGSASDAANTQANAATQASQAQVQAAKIASDTELQMFNQTSANMAPFMGAGTLALGDLMTLTGMTSGAPNIASGPGAPPSPADINAAATKFGIQKGFLPPNFDPAQLTAQQLTNLKLDGFNPATATSAPPLGVPKAPIMSSAPTAPGGVMQPAGQPSVAPSRQGFDPTGAGMSPTDMANLSSIMNPNLGQGGAVITPADLATLLGGKGIAQAGGQPLSTIANAAGFPTQAAAPAPGAPAAAPATGNSNPGGFGTPTNDLNTILNSPLLRAPTSADFHKSPGFDFQFQQGMQGLENAASVGGGIGGNTLKAAMQYGTGLANQDWWNFYNSFTGNQNRVISTLGGMASAGQNAAGNLGNAGTATAASIGSNTIGAGNAAANGIIGAGMASSANSIAQGSNLSSIFQNVANNRQFTDFLSNAFGGGGFTANNTATNFDALGASQGGNGAPTLF